MEGGEPPPERPPHDRARLITSPSLASPSDNGSGGLDKMRSRLAEMAYTDPEKTTENHPRAYRDEPIDSASSRSRAVSDTSRRVAPLVVMLVVCLVLLVGFALLSVVLKIRLDELYKTCATPECSMLSGEMLSRMAVDRNPCQDFYEYSCSSFNQPEHRPPDKPEWNQFLVVSHNTLSRIRYLLSTNGSEYKGVPSTAVSKAKHLHSGCLNTSRADADGVSNLLQLVRALGSWPLTPDLTGGAWDERGWSLQEALHGALSAGFSPFLALGVEPDLHNSSQHLLALEQSGLLLYSQKLYNSEDVEKFKVAYINLFKEVAGVLGAESSSQHAEEVWELERALAGAFVPREDLVEVESTYNVMTLSDLQFLLTSGHVTVPLDVLDLAQRLVHPGLTGASNINVATPQYFRKLGFILQAARPSTLASYVVWVGVREMLKHGGSRFEGARLRFTELLSGVSEPSPRWKQCVATTVQVMGFATGALYVESYFRGENKRAVEQLIQTIIEEYTEQLKSVQWMDETTRRRAREKARLIESKVGYPQFIEDPSLLDKHYEELNVSEDAFRSVLAYKRFEVRRNARKLGRRPDRGEWLDYPTEVNAYYSRSTNQIVIPAGILQKPFYDSAFPMSVLFGGIGYVIGHELTHGFDNNGRKFDGKGNLVDWWSENSARNFIERSQCFRKQYDSYTVNGLHLNGLTTLGENIADNGGAKLSLAAYRRWVARPWLQTGGRGDPVLPGLNMTRQQQFFLGFAQLWCSTATDENIRENVMTNVHSFKRFRVNGVVSNLPEFSEAFKCSNKDAKKSGDICVLW